jgi:hypothetical protein
MMMSIYWNRANYRGVAHATEFRNAVCGTHMGYGIFTHARDDDAKCKRCVKIVAKREAMTTDATPDTLSARLDIINSLLFLQLTTDATTQK